MAIKFKPLGSLNVAADPASLAETVQNVDIFSDALTRCKNLRLDQPTIAKTRDGSVILTSSLATPIHLLLQQGTTRYDFAGTNIYSNGTSIASSLANSIWSAILYNSFSSTTENVFALNGTNLKRIAGTTVANWGITAPASAPTLAVGASTGLTGAYNVKYTYARLEGTTVVSESNPSPAAGSAQTLTNQSLSVTWTASTDSQVTHVRIYRTQAGGAIYYHDQNVAIGSVTVDTNTADGSLGDAVATNHDTPPTGSFVFGPSYNGYCFILKNNLLYFCLAKQPEYWPSTYFVEVSPPQFPLQWGGFYNGQPFVMSKNEIYLIQGTGANTFFPLPMKALTGVVGPRAALSVKGHGLYHVGNDGLYLFDGSSDKKVSNDFAPLFRNETTKGMPGTSTLASSWLAQWHDKLYWSYDGTNTLVFNMSTSRVAYYSWGQAFATVAIDTNSDRIIAGDSSGNVWHLESSAHTTDNGTAISWEIESKDFGLQLRRHFPRWVKYDVTVGASATATGAVVLDGTTLQSHSITGTRNVVRRLVATGNGSRQSFYLSGSGAVIVYAVEGE